MYVHIYCLVFVPLTSLPNPSLRQLPSVTESCAVSVVGSHAGTYHHATGGGMAGGGAITLPQIEPKPLNLSVVPSGFTSMAASHKSTAHSRFLPVLHNPTERQLVKVSCKTL